MKQSIRQSLKHPNFFEGVAVAFALSVLGSAFALVLAPLFGRSFVGYVLISGVSFIYLIYLLARSQERVGRITTVVLWVAVTGLAWIAGLPWFLLGVVQVGFIWLVRSLYFYSSVIAALTDLGLTATSVIVAYWAATYSESLFLSIWTFFLMQALFVAIPKQWRAGREEHQLLQDDAFQQAFRNAEAAVRKLSTLR
ncbi:MAG: hypothetical protein PVF82_18130 [Gammaproteobacteria bacterium]|jgi:hypothetical protein